jgi:hypothetical protein
MAVPMARRVASGFLVFADDIDLAAGFLDTK